MVVRKHKNHISIVLLLYFVTVFTCAGCRKAPVRTQKTPPDESVFYSHRGLEAVETPILSLGALAQDHGLEVGAAVQARPLKSERLYALTLIREFSMLIPENAMKFDHIHPKPDRYCWEDPDCPNDADNIVDFAEENGMKVRGHTLVWHRQLPVWLTNLEETLRSDDEWSSNDRLQFIEILRDHIMNVVGYYRGRIVAWDVVNEPLTDDGLYRNTI